MIYRSIGSQAAVAPSRRCPTRGNSVVVERNDPPRTDVLVTGRAFVVRRYLGNALSPEMFLHLRSGPEHVFYFLSACTAYRLVEFGFLSENTRVSCSLCIVV